MGWTKAKTFAEKVATGDLSFERITKIMEEAIRYGRTQERAAAITRVRRAYRAGDMYWGDLASPEILTDVVDAIDPAAAARRG